MKDERRKKIPLSSLQRSLMTRWTFQPLSTDVLSSRSKFGDDTFPQAETSGEVWRMVDVEEGEHMEFAPPLSPRFWNYLPILKAQGVDIVIDIVQAQSLLQNVKSRDYTHIPPFSKLQCPPLLAPSHFRVLAVLFSVIIALFFP